MLPTPRRGRCTARRACGSGPACRSPAPCERHRGQGQGQGQGCATRAGASKRRQRGQAGSARVQAKAQPPGASPVPKLVTCRYSDAAPRVRCGGKGAHSRELLWPQSWNKSTVWLLCSAYAGRAVAARRAAAARLPEKMGGRQASVCSAAQCTHGRFCVASSHMMMASEYTSQACGRATVHRRRWASSWNDSHWHA